MPEDTPLELSFERERETKNTVRYRELAADGEEAVGSLYMQKHAVLELGEPERLRVTIAVRAA